MSYKKSPELCVTKLCRNKHTTKSPKCSKCLMRQWRKENFHKDKLARLRHRAKRKSLPFDLDLEWLMVFLTENGYDPTLHHIDRISVFGGYVKTNLQVLLMSDNIAKGNRERHGQAYAF